MSLIIMKVFSSTPLFLPLAPLIILALFDTTFCETTSAPTGEIKALINGQTTAAFIHSTEPTLKPLRSSAFPDGSTTKESAKTTKAYVATESPAAASHSTTREYTSTKSSAKSARKQKLHTSSSVVSSALSQERLGAIDCDLPVLSNQSRLWRGNETHELNLPIMDCGGSGGATQDCRPVFVWEGSADIQTGDVLIVRIDESLLIDTSKNITLDVKSSRHDEERSSSPAAPLQPAVYQVTRQGHEHCDITEGMLVDVTPLDDGGAKLFTLYDKDLNEGVNLFIVVSKHWESQCIRLKVTVKSDNCGESQDCSGKGICYTNITMEGYECQCCPGYAAPHCEERDPCNPTPCLNNGICVGLTQVTSGNDYHCLCPYGFTGRRCETDPCSSSPCLNDGSCMSMAMNGSTTFHCACADGWTGAHCELSAYGSACDLNPCVNGICVEHLDEDAEQKIRCFCQPGFTGDRCEREYNECESTPCANGGTCTDRVGAFACSCGRGYNGITCQFKVDLCSPNPCPGGRYCVDRGNTFTCECPRGFVGDECHIPIRSPCDNNPCAHGGTCWNDGESFYCSCRPGYTGQLCEEDFILESVVGEEDARGLSGGGGVRESRLPLGLYHDRLHNVYIAAGTLGAAIAIVGVVVTACHCRVNKTYSRMLSRLSRVTEAGPSHHWLQDKRSPSTTSAAPFQPPNTALDTTDMYYTLDFSDSHSQHSPLIQ